MIKIFLSITMICFAVTGAIADSLPLISVKEVSKIQPVQFVDVRPEHQFIGWDTEKGKGGHIEGAKDFPLSWFDLAKSPEELDNELTRRELKKDMDTVLYGNDTLGLDAYDLFVGAGFKHVKILEGGLEKWIESGHTVKKMARYERLVYPEWVEELVNGRSPKTFKGGDFRVVEVNLPFEKDDFLRGHIPGAITVDDTINHVRGVRILADYQSIPMTEQLKFWNRPNDDDIKKKLEAMGVTSDTTVILYGSVAATTAAYRAGMIMHYAGVKDIRFLNGGKPLWELENLPLEKGENEWTSVDNFGVQIPQNPEVLIDYDEELAMVKNPDAVIASIRSWPEYLCEISGYTYIGEAGDIAKSRFGYAGSDPYAMEDYRNLDNTMFNYELIADRWKKWGITPDKAVSFHCGTGWRASETYFYAYAMGWDNIRVYDGGWYEWHKKKDSPRKEKGLPEDAPERKPHSFFKTTSKK